MGHIHEAKLGAVIDRFYEAAVRPELWRAVLHEAGEVIGGVGAILLPGPKAPVTAIWSQALDEGVELGMRQGWYADNPRVTRGVPALMGDRDIITEARIFTREELERVPFNAEFVRRTGMGDFAGMLLAPAGPASVILSFERSLAQEAFSSSELESIRRALPHLQRAGHLVIRLAGARAEGMLDAFDLMNCGGALLDFMGRVIRLNAKAERLMGRGLALRQNQLTASAGDGNTGLQRLIGSAVRPGLAHEAPAIGAVAVPRPEGRPLIVHAAPIAGAAQDIFQQAKAILMIVDPDEHREPAEPILRQAFRLTPAEARLAIGLAGGRDLKEIAEASGVSEGTVRSHLKSVFAKTNTNRQAELVALLSRFGLPASTRIQAP